MAQPPLKLVLVGDGFVGKTCLIGRFTSGKFQAKYAPTVVDNTFHDLSVDNQSVRLCLCDTAGQEDYDRLRPLSYPDTDVFLVCFSVESRDSFRNVRDKWHPELTHYRPGMPMLLVGTKTDLRTDQVTIEHLQRQGVASVSVQEGELMAKYIGAHKYVECSALMHQGLDDVFKEAVRAHFAAKGLGKKRQSRFKASGCSLL